MTTHDSARQIAEDMLERTGRALMSGDFETFSACFRLPHRTGTFEGSSEMSNTNDLRSVFNGMRQHFHHNRVSRMERRIVEAAFTDTRTIRSTHETRLLDGVILVQRPYPVISTLRLFEDNWLICEGEYAIVDSPQQVRILAKPEKQMTDAEDESEGRRDTA